MVTVTAKPSLTIRRRFNAPPGKVFEAWTDPEKLKHWMGGREIASVTAETDVRVGGGFRIAMQKLGENEQHDVSGVYREVIPNEKLVFTWAWKTTPERESLVTVTFKADNGGTLMTFTHEQFFDEDARDRHQHGWNASFEKLEKYVAE
ncbi:MAG TPA: SRPBCC domain-containing protein [Pseudolabrys sp.]|nr:SRPBCC domain-containing protein [Pseudolabrys sp.]